MGGKFGQGGLKHPSTYPPAPVPTNFLPLASSETLSKYGEGKEYLPALMRAMVMTVLRPSKGLKPPSMQ